MINEDQNSLYIVSQNKQEADIFYTSELKASAIKRFDTNSIENMEMRNQNVDLLITLDDKTYKVAENFSKDESENLYVEIYKAYPKTMGWVYTGSPDLIFYFTPRNVYSVEYKSLSAFCINTLIPLIPKMWYRHFKNSKKSPVYKMIKCNDDTFRIKLVQEELEKNRPILSIGIHVPIWVFKSNNLRVKNIERLYKSRLPIM